jgi:hypothetical protein
MKLIIGMTLLVAGLVLLGFGAHFADSPLSEISEAFTGEPSDRALTFLISGAVAAFAGLATIVLPAKT